METLAELYSPLLRRKIDPMAEVVTYLGAQEGIVMAMLAFCSAGDEVRVADLLSALALVAQDVQPLF